MQAAAGRELQPQFLTAERLLMKVQEVPRTRRSPQARSAAAA